LDIIVLTETWRNVEYCNYSIPGYKLYFSTLKRNQNAGVMVFVKIHLNVVFFQCRHLVANILKFNLIIDKIPEMILCIYRSPSSDSNEFLTTFFETLDREKHANSYLIITGRYEHKYCRK